MITEDEFYELRAMAAAKRYSVHKFFMDRGLNYGGLQHRFKAPKHRMHTKETVLRVNRLREEGKTWAEIKAVLNITLTSFKAHAKAYGIAIARKPTKAQLMPDLKGVKRGDYQML